MSVLFYPRGGSSQVVRYLVPALEAAYWQHRPPYDAGLLYPVDRAPQRQALGLDLFGEGLDDNWTVTAIRAASGEPLSRSMAAIPSAGPTASMAKAQPQLEASRTPGTSQIVATVRVNPTASWRVSAVPT